MKRILLLVAVSLFFSCAGLAQQERLTTPLPTVIIKGEDRSYMEIIRTKKLSYMRLRGEKSKKKPSLEIALLP
ncbi:hypothetical protein J7M02_02040, partial [Candidatus Aerophobetes bacterium]|nr:hypothetical protein [Candidatus Aerophobetes bacterium]